MRRYRLEWLPQFGWKQNESDVLHPAYRHRPAVIRNWTTPRRSTRTSPTGPSGSTRCRRPRSETAIASAPPTSVASHVGRRLRLERGVRCRSPGVPSPSFFAPHPSPGVQPARSEPRPPGSGGGRQDDGYLDLSSDEMSQTFTVLSQLPLTPPALRHLWSRLRSLPTGLRYGSAHQTCPRLRRPT